MKYNVLCTICMRDGSKGVKDKCIKKINKKHLFLYTSESFCSFTLSLLTLYNFFKMIIFFYELLIILF